MTTYNYIRIIFVSLFYLSSLASCQTRNNTDLLDNLEALPARKIPVDTSAKNILFTNTVNQMIEDNGVRWTESFTGEKSKQAVRYEWLSKNASDKQLLELINSKHANLRAYAFLCLKDRDYIDLKSIIVNHLKDTLSFEESSACFGEMKVMNAFCLEQYPGHFSNDELKKYRNLIAQCNSKLTIFKSQ